jgi:predicted metal-dependent RNase
MTSIRFLGAADTVTGSRFLVRAGEAVVLVDAGLLNRDATSLAVGASRLDTMGWTLRVPVHMEEVSLP